MPVDWEISEVIAEDVEEPKWALQNVVKLFEDDNSIPFIARYRKEMTNNMSAEKLRKVKDQYDELKCVIVKVESVTETLVKEEKLDETLKCALSSAKTLTEVDHLYAPFKPGSKRTLAERAREAGLEEVAMKILEKNSADLNSVIQQGKEGVSSMKEVETGVQHIIADVLSKDKEVMTFMRNLCKTANISINTSQLKVKKSTKDKKEDSKGELKTQQNAVKFEQYFDKSIPVRYIKPYQVLAINRGENLKILSVKVVLPDHMKKCFHNFCMNRWIRPNAFTNVRNLMIKSIEDSYARLVQPLLCRSIRSQLGTTAEKASIEVFASNLKRLLLTPPVRGKVVLGMDPGFRHGCKMAVTSPTGQVLHTDVIYIHTGSKLTSEVVKLKNILQTYTCETVAIGNGTACRETENFLSHHIEIGFFSPLNVVYCIVNESGASIYSASKEADSEFPQMDVSLRGAVSIARRLQDPLAELVKIEPKHIGVGMYQHDTSESKMKTALGGVVEDCVSFVGVDLNTCSDTLLQKVAGLNKTKSKKILEWREQNGGFRNRTQLTLIKGLGPKTFEQCAGFVRIMPDSVDKNRDECVKCEPEPSKPDTGKKRKAESGKAKSKKQKLEASSELNPLDMTCVHPESYDVAERFMALCGGQKEEIGRDTLIRKVKQFMRTSDVGKLSSDLNVGEATLQLIVDGLQQPIGHDIREEFEKPLFKKGIASMDDLKIGSILTGRVENSTHFGAFVDIGVCQNGLIHTSKMRALTLSGRRSLELGDKVEVKVLSVDVAKKRIALELKAVL